MGKPLKAIVENGYQILQTPNGKRINYLTLTQITQTTEKEAECVFEVNANYKGGDLESLLFYPEYLKLITQAGEVLEVEILDYKNVDRALDKVKVKCTVTFPYETNHHLTAQPVTEYA